MTDDERPTPQIQPAPKYLRDFGSGPHHEPTDPRIYLATEASVEEQQLVDDCDRHAGSHAPFIAIVKVALRGQKTETKLGEFARDTAIVVNQLAGEIQPERLVELERHKRRFDGAMKKGRRFLWSAVIAAATSLGGVAIWALNSAKASGAAEQRQLNLEHAIEELKTDIREIRASLGVRSSRPSQHTGAGFLVPPQITLNTDTDTDTKGPGQ